MTFNKRMHHRNKYRSPPNFKQLAVEFEEFREYAVQDLSGKISIDFKNAAALRALTRVLLLKDWNLDVEIPNNRLVPTLPLRLNYLLWIEDLLASIGKDLTKDSIHGIDIGTGAACVYPLLAAKKNGWHMLATEVDEESANYAKANVIKNNLESLIKVQQVSGESLLKEAIRKSDAGNEDSGSAPIYDFSMCNPPFFSNEDEMDNSTNGRSPVRPRAPPRNARTGSMREVVFEGGEVAFVSKMIEEGKKLQHRIRIMTTMLGHKSSVSRVEQILSDEGVRNTARTEFCQGRTMRWGLAWSHTVDLSPAKAVAQAPAPKKEKPRPPLQYLVPESCGNDIDAVAERITAILDSLKAKHELHEMKSNQLTYQVRCFENTWSNQRRKRREQKRQGKPTEQPQAEGDQQGLERKEEPADQSRKRTLEEETEERTNPSEKRPKIDVPTAPILVMNLVIRREEESEGESEEQADTDKNGILVEVMWIEGSGGRELVHQVLQFIKNNLATRGNESLVPKT